MDESPYIDQKYIDQLIQENNKLVIYNTNLELELQSLKDYIKELEVEVEALK